MDKSWINMSRMSKEYRSGVKSFITFAKKNSFEDDLILCPCNRCTNCDLRTCDVVETHLICHGFLAGYTEWYCHGEVPLSHFNNPFELEYESLSNIPTTSPIEDDLSSDNGLQALVNDVLEMHNASHDQVHHDSNETSQIGGSHEKEYEAFSKSMEDVSKPLYHGCTKFSKLSFVVRLFQIKCLSGWSAKSFTMLLELLNEAFPEISIPNSAPEIKKFLKSFELGYEKIAACPNDCMLFRGDKESLENCEVCGTSKWAETLDEHQKEAEAVDGQQEADQPCRKKKKKFAKILRYFPLIPRLQRLFMSSKTSRDMRWHGEASHQDGFLEHPVDGESWKKFDERYTDFAEDDRNLKLAIASDGVSPYREMSSTYSIWPVVLIPYNLPPWKCMKQSSFILSMIIPGPKAPGNDIDVYLQPLIDELQKLWEGVPTYDATTKEIFNFRAALMWTLNDLPGYRYMSGYSTSGRYGCPCCGDETVSRWLFNGKKFCYMGHRRWLPDSHKFRAEKESFDGHEEWRHAPTPFTGSDVLRKLDGHQFTYGKLSKVQKKGKKMLRDEEAAFCDEVELEDPADLGSWRKKSIFFQLPYWEFNSLRHNIDVMHVGKNIGENCVGTVMGDVRKTKDNFNSRLDLESMDIRRELHPIYHPDGHVELPPATYTMLKHERDLFCKILKELKVPDGYSSNIARCVNLKESRLQGLKSHDYHILMKDLLPVALRSSICNPVLAVLKELCSIYKGLCSTTIRIEDLDQLEHRAALTHCQMERIFPPSFFTIMIHLIIHLAAEVRLGGPVQYRWMYPIERFWYRLKGCVRNRAHPEGSIAEWYLAEEVSIFCSRYLEDVETMVNRPRRNSNISNLEGVEYLFCTAGRTMGKIEAIELDDLTWEQAHQYVLDHHASVEPFRIEFIKSIKKRHKRKKVPPREQNRLVNQQFHKWFETYVSNLRDEDVSSEIKILAKGPHKIAKRYKGYIYNGFRFRTKDYELSKKSQNSGILVTSKTRSYASSKDTKPLDGDVEYCGVLTDIIDLDYYGQFRVVLFRGEWAGPNKDHPKNRDKLGFTVVSFSNLVHTGEQISHEPFVFPSQVQQVFYVLDPSSENSFIAVKVQPRDGFQLGNNSEDEDDDVMNNFTASEFPMFTTNIDDDDGLPTWVRADGSRGIIIDNL